MIDGVLVQVRLTVGPPSPSCGDFPSSGMHNWTKYTQQLIESQTCEGRASLVGKGTGTPLELPACRETVNQKQ